MGDSMVAWVTCYWYLDRYLKAASVVELTARP